MGVWGYMVVCEMLWKRNEGGDIARKVISVNTRISLFTFDFPVRFHTEPQKQPNNTDSAVSPSIA
jgi:hypothetical protein